MSTSGVAVRDVQPAGSGLAGSSPAGGGPAASGPAGSGDAALTRDVMLRSARKRFSIYGYADVTLRDIAADCGVSPALVVKYFGTKENLFAEAVSFERDAAEFFDALDGDDPGRQLIAALLDYHEQHQSDPLLRALFACARQQVAEFRENFERQFISALAARLRGPDARLRAELVCAQLIGLAAVRLAMQTSAIAVQPREQLVEWYAPALRAFLDGSDS